MITEKQTKTDMPEKRADAHVWLLGFKEIKENWLDEVRSERTGSERTSGVYLDHMRAFIAYTNMTPAELIAKAFEEQKREMTADAPTTKTWAEKQTIACFNALQEQGRARIGALGVYGAARSFFRYNGIQFKGKTPNASVETIYRLPTEKQLTQAWKVATHTQKMAAGILRSTAARPEDALALVWRDLQWQYDPKRAYIEKISQKEDLPFGVYLTEETSELVRLDMRVRFGDQEPPANAKLLPYKYTCLLGVIHRFGEKVGLKLSPKYFRKKFRTKCSPIIGRDAVQKMAAWAIPGAGKHYVLPSPEETLENYLRIEALLTFEPKAVTDKEQQTQNLINFAIAQGLPPQQAQRMAIAFREKALAPDQAAVEIRKALKQVQPAGMLNAEQTAARQFAKILLEALKEVKQKLKSEVLTLFFHKR